MHILINKYGLQVFAGYTLIPLIEEKYKECNWYPAPPNFAPNFDICILRNGAPVLLSYAEKGILKAQDKCLTELSNQPTFEAVQDSVRAAFDIDAELYTQVMIDEIKGILIEKLNQGKEAFYKTGFGFICLAKPDEILVFDSDKKSGKSIQSRVELRKDVPELQARPEKVTMQNNIRILMAHEEFVFFYQQLSYFISVVEDAFGDAREAVLKTITVKDLLDIPAPDYNKAVEVIPRTFMPKATIWERRDKYVNNIRVVRWLNSGWFSKRFGDGYLTDPAIDKEQI